MTDRLSTSGYQPGMVNTLWENHHKRFLRRDNRIQTIRQLYAGLLKIPLPEAFNIQGREYLEFGLPTKWMMPLHLGTVLMEKAAKIKRNGGTDQINGEKATEVELWCNAALEQTLDQDTMVDLLLNEGECGLVVALSGTGWEDKNDVVASDNKSSRETIAKRKDFQARHFPFTCRVIAADDCVPIHGPNLTLEGLLVRTSYAKERLIQRGYAWDKEDDLHIPAGNPQTRSVSSGEQVTLYEAYLLDEQGKPYVVYEVDGAVRTWKMDEKGNKNFPVVDLYGEFGMTRLPCAYGYGLHFARSNPENPGAPLGIPFAWPLIGVLLMKELVACGISVKTWWSGFPGYAFKPDENMLATHPELLLENDAPRDFVLKSMEVTPIPGDLMPLQSPGLGPEVGAVMNLLNEAMAEYGPNPVSAGAAGATGVSDRSLIDEQIRRAHAAVLKTRRRMVEESAEIMLEYGTRWSDRTTLPLPIYADVPVPTLSGSSKRKVTKRGIVEIDPETVGDNYSVTAYYPREFGDNLARTQQILEAHKDGASPFVEMREVGFEDEDPEETRVQLILDKFYASDEYQAEVLADALQANGDTKLATKMRMKAQGKLTDGGLPTGGVAGVVPPPGAGQPGLPPGVPPPPGPMPPGGAPTVNMALPNPGLSQLGGQVGAQVQAAQAVAGPMAGGG